MPKTKVQPDADISTYRSTGSKRYSPSSNTKRTIKSSKTALRLTKDLKKAQAYFQNQVKMLEAVADDINLPMHLESIKRFNALGESIYGFRWASKNFLSSEAQTGGSPEDREQLLRLCLRASINIMKDHDKYEKSRRESSRVAYEFCCHIFAQICAILGTVFLFTSNKTRLAWFSLSFFILNRLVSVLTVPFQKGSCIHYLETFTGITIFTDVYRGRTQEKFYQNKGVDIHKITLMRKVIGGIFQLIPQTILNIGIIINTLEKKDNIDALFVALMISVISALLSLCIFPAYYNKNLMKYFIKVRFYHGMTHYVPDEANLAQQQLLFGVMHTWYLLHFIIVCTGVATLIKLTPYEISMSIIGGFIFVVNLLRAIQNGGELRFYRRVRPTLFNNFASAIMSIVGYGIGPALMPLSMFRFHYLLGPTIFAFTWIVSFGIGVITVFICVKNTVILGFISILCFLYISVVVIFFITCRENTWKTFFFSKKTWRGILRDEIWNERNYVSSYWNNPLLVGDEDAHYAAMIAKYLASDLPWDKLKKWIISKKGDFLIDPPLWLTNDWISLIPKKIRNQIWTSDEMLDLKDSIRQGGRNFDSMSQQFSKHKLGDTERNKEKTLDIENGIAKPMDIENGTVKSMDIENGTAKTKKDNAQNDFNMNSQITDVQAKSKTSSNESKSKMLRKRIFKSSRFIESRRLSSSILPGLRHSMNDGVALEELGVPIFLEGLLKSASSIHAIEVNEVIEAALKEEFAQVMIKSNGLNEKDNFPAILVGAMVTHHLNYSKKDLQKHNFSRTVIAACFEIADEVSDLFLAVLYSTYAKDFQWAGIVMYIFIALNRTVMSYMSYCYKEPLLQNIESLLGLRCVTDPYRLVTKGADARNGGVKVIVMRPVTLTVGLILESLPQMMLQLIIIMRQNQKSNLSNDIIGAQILSILASCFSIGLSMGTMSIEHSKAMKIIHPSGCKWVPFKDAFRETLLHVCLVIWSSIHVFVVTCAISTLYVYGNLTVFFSIILGHCFVFTVISYKINDCGWEGMSWYMIRSKPTSAILLPISIALKCFAGSFLPLMSLRLQQVLGPFLFTYGVASSFLLSVVTLLMYLPTLTMQLYFSGLFFVYAVIVVTFLGSIDEDVFDFLFSRSNFKETLRDELWDIPHHSSDVWEIKELYGDHDANHAAFVEIYRTCDLPWKKITTWLRSKKRKFLESPPLWLTTKWFSHLPPQVKRDVWTEPGELEELIAKVEAVWAEAKLSERHLPRIT